MSEIFEKYARLRELYPDDVQHIEAEEARVKKLLAQEEFSKHPVTKELLEMCRKEVVSFRRYLATDRRLTQEMRQAIWSDIDARLWFIDMIGKDFQAEIDAIEASLQRELEP
jgi:hypothetical protein